MTCEQCVQPSCLCADTIPKGDMPRTDLKGKKRYTEEADSNIPTNIRQHKLCSFYLGPYHFSFISLLKKEEKNNVPCL